MSTFHTIVLRQGDSDTLTEVIENLTVLTGYTAKMYIVKSDGTEVDTITGTIDTLTITYEIVNESSKVYPVGVHDFETKIFDSSDHVYTPSYGKFIVESAKEEDPA
jgi:hypothetical protein